MSLIERVISNIKDRRQRLLDGNINSIPLPFNRFRNELPGIEQGKYILVSGATKSGKSQLTNYLFVYNTIFYAYHNRDKITPKIFYYALEETPENISGCSCIFQSSDVYAEKYIFAPSFDTTAFCTK